MNKDSSRPPIVELRGVRFDQVEAPPLDLGIGPGELAFVDGVSNIQRSPLADCIQGSKAAVDGEVLFEGLSWERRNTHEIESARRSIGRIFGSASAVSSWVQNLNVTDNVLLAQRFCRGVSETDLIQRAEGLAQRFGLASLPRSRPAATPTEKLALSQWVRAFLPDPLRLLILEQPASRAPESSLHALLEAVSDARAGGGAVLWIDKQSDIGLDLEQLAPNQTFSLASAGGIQPKG